MFGYSIIKSWKLDKLRKELLLCRNNQISYQSGYSRCLHKKEEAEYKSELYKKGFEACINILNPEQERIIHNTIKEVHIGTQSK